MYISNLNTPFAINLTTPEPDGHDKKSNADLICVIDISASMCGAKIQQVKDSLKILLDLMDEKDRICLILFVQDPLLVVWVIVIHNFGLLMIVLLLKVVLITDMPFMS